MTYATPEMVATELGRPADSITDVERTQWQQWLDDVELEIATAFRRRGLTLMGSVAAGDPQADAVARVERSAVVRKVNNPTGESSRTSTVSVDDGSVSNTRRYETTTVGSDPLALTDAEWALLLPDRRRRAHVFSVMPS